jgi:hypothetical protein
MIGIIDVNVYQLYVVALSSTFERSGHGLFESKIFAEHIIRHKMSNDE